MRLQAAEANNDIAGATINYDNCTSSSPPPPGTQVAVVVVTTNGVLAQYTTTWP
ncbi:MAG: hypothetical protein RXP86_08615 [Acidilobus sp.]